MARPERCPNCGGPLVQDCEDGWKACPLCNWNEKESEDLDR